MTEEVYDGVFAGQFVIAWLAEMEERGLRAVYLRNYEALPADIGNDVDLLIETGTTQTWINEAKEVAPRFGWRFLRAVPFGCTSLFFFRPDADEVLHIDLNERIEWHCVPFADGKGILSRRRWNGKVFIPAVEDELYLNVATRLVYQGKVREKHRVQWTRLRPSCSKESLTHAFSDLGPTNIANQIIDAADSGDWNAVEALHVRIRRCILGKAALRPCQTTAGIARFARRTMRRIVRPPGYRFLFVVPEPLKSDISAALSKCNELLSRWGNLSKCLLETSKGFSDLIRRYLFRSRNGVVVQVVPSFPAWKSLHRGNTIWIPIDGIAGADIPSEALAHRMVDAVRASIASQMEKGIATK